MPKRTPLPATGVWKLVARAQRVGLSEGMRGKGSTWLVLGVGAWGLQRIRSMAGEEQEILIREPLAPGQSMTITATTVTRTEAKQQQKQADKDAKAARKQAKRERKRTKKARSH